ncbi:hypothetical protein [Streptomyces sp. AHA2]|uniref:hypothetical protein n=1 Tax=Streptomyces sp. AHA2 TaxID=3064526 RepID=UPI002FE093EA
MSAPGKEDENEDVFFRDMAECVSTNQEAGPALVWPRNADRMLERLRTEHDRTLEGGTGPHGLTGRREEEPARPLARLMAYRLRTLLGVSAVRADVRDLVAGQASGHLPADADTLLVMLRGALECSVGPASADTPERHLPLTLRMRVGEVLYVPRAYPFSLTAGRAAATVLQLGLVRSAPRPAL